MGSADLNDEVFVSVITISRNAESTIARTIESVVNQTFHNFEYIIVDGLSNDRTMDIVKKYNTDFDRKGIQYTYISEKDDGIYDAMNKGICMANGKWLIFLNANDSFYSNNVLSLVFASEYDEGIQCIYGNTINIIENKKYIKESYDMEVIYYKAPFIHQALFAKRDVLLKYRFNTNYRYSADYDQFVRMYRDGIKFLKINIIVSNYDMTGISQKNSKAVTKEWKQIQKANGIAYKKCFRKFVRRIELGLKNIKFIYNFYLKIKQRRGTGEYKDTI